MPHAYVTTGTTALVELNTVQYITDFPRVLVRMAYLKYAIAKCDISGCSQNRTRLTGPFQSEALHENLIHSHVFLLLVWIGVVVVRSIAIGVGVLIVVGIFVGVGKDVHVTHDLKGSTAQCAIVAGFAVGSTQKTSFFAQKEGKGSLGISQDSALGRLPNLKDGMGAQYVRDVTIRIFRGHFRKQQCQIGIALASSSSIIIIVAIYGWLLELGGCNCNRLRRGQCHRKHNPYRHEKDVPRIIKIIMIH